MTKLQQVKQIQQQLLQWYHHSARDLPWRKTKHPYAIWVSEIMLQQTQVDTVIPYYHRFLKKMPNAKRLAEAHEDEVLKLWEGLGYYRRARALHAAAKLLQAEFKGQYPKNAGEWERLPGIGRYTANAIASIAYDQPVAVLDGNVKRVIARLICYQQAINQAKADDELWHLADRLLSHDQPGDFNQAMMELGAVICKETQPLCDLCPIGNCCQAKKQNQQNSYPIRNARKKIPHRKVVVAVIENDAGEWLIGKRPADAMLGGLWEFPGGKVEHRESLEQALQRELHEELGVKPEIGEKIGSIKHAYTHFKITMHAFFVRMPMGQKLAANYHQSLKWVEPEKLEHYALPTANQKLIRLLKRREKLSVE